MARPVSMTLVICALLLLILPAGARGDVHRFVEDFTSRAYCDTFRTTARWDTVDGEISLFSFPFSQIGGIGGIGSIVDLDVAGDIGCAVSSSGTFVSFDVSDPSSPQLLSSIGIANECFGVVVSGNHAFVSALLTASGPAVLRVIDVTDPTGPIPVGSCTVTGEPGGVAVEGDHALVALGTTGLCMIDVSAPAAPSLLGCVDTPGTAHDVVPSGDLAIVADGLSGLQVVDISDPLSPSLIGSCDTPGDAVGVVVDGDRAYVADGSAGLAIVDLSDPTSPTVVGVATPGSAAGVAVAGRHAYIAGGSSGIHAIDVGDPSSPWLLGTGDTSGEAASIVVAGGHAFVADGAAGLAVVEISERVAPVVVGAGGAWEFWYRRDLAVAGDRAYIIGFDLEIMDLSDPTNPTLLATADIAGTGIATAGDYAFIATSRSGGVDDVAVVDISDPGDPRIVVSGGRESPIGDIAVAGDHAYVAAYTEGLLVFDITDPTSPARVGSCAVNYGGYDVAVDGDHAFVADANGLSVVDIGTPTSPTLIASCETPGFATGVAVSGDHAFVADGHEGLSVIDVSDPSNPTIVGQYDVGIADIGEVALDGNVAYVLESPDYGNSSFYVLDVSDPTAPTVLEEGPLLAIMGEGLAVAGDYVYAAGSPENLWYDPSLHVLWTRQRDVVGVGDEVQSLNLEPSEYEAAFARIVTTQTDSIRWELSPDGLSWMHVPPTGEWCEFPTPGPSLYWRTEHALLPEGVNPTCSDLEIEWVRTSPWIETVTDVPGDQGRQVTVIWTKSGYDYVGSSHAVTQYAIYRRIDDVPGPARAMERRVEGAPVLWPPGDWHFVTTVPAAGDAEYAALVPTLADSTAATGMHHSTFFVRALTAVPAVYFDSPPDSGYSVDNLAPEPPAGFAVDYGASQNMLSWEESEAEDFDQFLVYRSTDPEFVTGPEHLVHTTTALDWTDEVENGWQYAYRIAATDRSGNESDPAAPESVTGVAESLEHTSFALHQNIPNPLVERTTILYDVPAPGAEVTIEIFDVAGRRVRTLVDGHEGAGRRKVAWDRRDECGLRVASGVYYCRLVTPGFEGTRKMIVVK